MKINTKEQKLSHWVLRIAAGDVEGANVSAKKVRMFFWIGLIVNIVLIAFYIIFFAVAASQR